MIKHIVMWRLEEKAGGATREENARELKARLEALIGRISEIRALEVGINIDTTEAASDVVLYTEFESLEDLKRYQAHEEHQKIVRFLNDVRIEKRVVDYETG